MTENNWDEIFSKLVVDAGCDNIPKSQKKFFLRSVGYRFVSSQSIWASMCFIVLVYLS